MKYLRDQARQLSLEEWRKVVYDPTLLEKWADEQVDKLYHW
jgi:hypothetical protein